MSRSRECAFIEPQPNKWFYLINNTGLSDLWDWREEAECVGPFASHDAAVAHLRETQANPGGWSIVPNSDYCTSQVLTDAINRAVEPRQRSRSLGRGI